MKSLVKKLSWIRQEEQQQQSHEVQLVAASPPTTSGGGGGSGEESPQRSPRTRSKSWGSNGTSLWRSPSWRKRFSLSSMSSSVGGGTSQSPQQQPRTGMGVAESGFPAYLVGELGGDIGLRAIAHCCFERIKTDPPWSEMLQKNAALSSMVKHKGLKHLTSLVSGQNPYHIASALMQDFHDNPEILDLMMSERCYQDSHSNLDHAMLECDLEPGLRFEVRRRLEQVREIYLARRDVLNDDDEEEARWRGDGGAAANSSSNRMLSSPHSYPSKTSAPTLLRPSTATSTTLNLDSMAGSFTTTRWKEGGKGFSLDMTSFDNNDSDEEDDVDGLIECNWGDNDNDDDYDEDAKSCFFGLKTSSNSDASKTPLSTRLGPADSGRARAKTSAATPPLSARRLLTASPGTDRETRRSVSLGAAGDYKPTP